MNTTRGVKSKRTAKEKEEGLKPNEFTDKGKKISIPYKTSKS